MKSHVMSNCLLSLMPGCVKDMAISVVHTSDKCLKKQQKEGVDICLINFHIT